MNTSDHSTDLVPISSMNRRRFLGRTIGALAVTGIAAGSATAAVSKLIGIADGPSTSQKFTGAGWYAFGRGGGSGMKVFYAEIDASEHRQNFIALSDGPGTPITWYVSAQSFDRGCWGICMTADEAERRAGTGRYAKGRAA